MVFRRKDPTVRRAAAVVVAAGILLLAMSPGPARSEDPEVIKGTVVSVRPEAIYLTTINAPDDNEPPRDVMVVIDDNTEYLDFTRRITRDEIVPGLKVLVRCRPNGGSRAALQVRIVGGKAP